VASVYLRRRIGFCRSKSMYFSQTDTPIRLETFAPPWVTLWSVNHARAVVRNREVIGIGNLQLSHGPATEAGSPPRLRTYTGDFRGGMDVIQAP
jgi:hypothetical protein